MSLTAEEERLVDQGFRKALDAIASNNGLTGMDMAELGGPAVADEIIRRLRAVGVTVELQAASQYVPFFERGKGPLVSVLLPTRHRVDSMLASIDSLYSLSAYKDMEFIFKIDDDDDETIYAFENVKKYVKAKAIISSQGNGYGDMHIWVNQMASLAEGDWLFIWNDDARMKTDRWDELLMMFGIAPEATWHGVKDIIMLLCDTIDRPQACEFAFLRRKVFEVLGHYSLNPHNDNWMMSVTSFLCCAFRAPISIEHLSNDLTDKIRTDVLTVYRKSGRDFNSMEQVSQRIEDVRKLMAYISAEQQKMKQSPVSI